MPFPVVFLDIAGPDDKALHDFYSGVFGWNCDDAGRFQLPVVSPLQGTIRKDPGEKRIYLGVPDVTAALAQVEQAGGTIDASRFEVAGVAVIGLFRDPAGNPMGLLEMDGDSHRVP